MLLIILSILAIIVMFKLTIFLLKLIGKMVGAIVSVLGYLVLGGALLTLSIPFVIIPIMAVSGIAAIIIGCLRA